MKKLYTYLAAILLIAGGTLWFYHANAKVCFLTDQQACNSQGSTGNIDPYGNGGTEDLCCGTAPDSWYSTYPYKVSDSSCKRANLCTEGVFGAPCSHDTRYGICCPRKYQYNSCAAPLVQDGRCGNKYACKCNDDCTAGKTCYKYYTNSSGACTDGSSYSETNAIPTGAQCLQISYDTGSAVEQMRYEKCECMKALFPYPADDDNAKCKQDFGDGAIVNTDSDACTEPSNDKFYKKCKCLPAYNITTCPYGLKEGANNDYCNAEGMYKYRDDACCKYDSSACHYETAPGTDQGVQSYRECDCPAGKYTATSCIDGYKLINGKCAKTGCKGALQEYFEMIGAETFVLYDGYGYKTKTINTNQEYPDLDGVEAIVVAEDTNPSTTQWTHFIDIPVISGIEYARNHAKGDSAQERAVQEQCTNIPTISSSSYTYSNTSSKTLDFTAVKLKFNNETIQPKLICTNCAIDIVGDVVAINDLKLTIDEYRANAPGSIDRNLPSYPLQIKGDNLKIGTNTTGAGIKFNSIGYNYDLQKLHVINRTVQNVYTGSIKNISYISKITFTGKYETPALQRRNNFKVSEFVLLGIAGMQDMDIVHTNAHIGNRTLIDTAPSWPCETKSFLTLRRTTMNLYEGGLKLCGESGVGYPADSGWTTFVKGNATSTTNAPKIIATDGTVYSGISQRIGQHKYASKDDTSGCKKSNCCQGKSDGDYNIRFAYLDERQQSDGSFDWEIISDFYAVDDQDSILVYNHDNYNNNNRGTACIFDASTGTALPYWNDACTNCYGRHIMQPYD